MAGSERVLRRDRGLPLRKEKYGAEKEIAAHPPRRTTPGRTPGDRRQPERTCARPPGSDEQDQRHRQRKEGYYSGHRDASGTVFRHVAAILVESSDRLRPRGRRARDSAADLEGSPTSDR